MGLEWGWICLWRGWGSVFPSKLLSTLFSKKVCLQDQEAKRHCEAASLKCAEHVPGCCLTSSPRIQLNHGIVKVRKDLQESPSPTIPPAQPRPPLNHIPKCCSLEISWAPSALPRRRRNIFWRNVFTDSGEEKKWGFYPTSPVWCPHTGHPFCLQQLGPFLMCFYGKTPLSGLSALCPTCGLVHKAQLRGIFPAPPLLWNPLISCCLHPLLDWSIQGSKQKEDYWVVCYGDKYKQNEKKNKN